MSWTRRFNSQMNERDVDTFFSRTMYSYEESRVKSMQRRKIKWNWCVEIWQMYWIWLKCSACGHLSRFLHSHSYFSHSLFILCCCSRFLFIRWTIACALPDRMFNVCAFIWINVFNGLFSFVVGGDVVGCPPPMKLCRNERPTKESNKKVNQFWNHILFASTNMKHFLSSDSHDSLSHRSSRKKEKTFQYQFLQRLSSLFSSFLSLSIARVPYNRQRLAFDFLVTWYAKRVMDMATISLRWWYEPLSSLWYSKFIDVSCPKYVCVCLAGFRCRSAKRQKKSNKATCSMQIS